MEMDKYEKLIDELTRPIFVWRMARADHQRKGAETRRVNALAEIEAILDKFNEENADG